MTRRLNLLAVMNQCPFLPATWPFLPSLVAGQKQEVRAPPPTALHFFPPPGVKVARSACAPEMLHVCRAAARAAEEGGDGLRPAVRLCTEARARRLPAPLHKNTGAGRAQSSRALPPRVHHRAPPLASARARRRSGSTWRPLCAPRTGKRRREVSRLVTTRGEEGIARQ